MDRDLAALTEQDLQHADATEADGRTKPAAETGSADASCEGGGAWDVPIAAERVRAGSRPLKSRTGPEQIVPLTVSPRTAACCAFCALPCQRKSLKVAQHLVPVAGIEPATFGLQNRCSTS